MFETAILLPLCNDGYKVHAWLADRMGAHRLPDMEYLHVTTSANDQTALVVMHSQPMKDLGEGAVQVQLPAAGATVKFRARLNPVRKQSGKRVGIQSHEIKDWLQRQVAGITVESCDVVSAGYEQFAKSRRESYWYWRMDVEGVLKVDSVQDMEKTMLGGVGRMKGFGMGLIAIEGMMAFNVLGM